MGIPRTTPAITLSSSTITPAVSGTVIPAVSFSISNGIATVVLGAGNLPANGYNGPNKAIGQPIGQGQQVTLWGFTTATYFNGKVVSVIDNDPIAGSFRFYFNHADVASTADAGNTAASPFEHFRAVRVEVDQNNSTDFVYVGDLNVSSTQYTAALSLTGQLAIEVASENVPGDRIWLIGRGAADKVHVSVLY